MTNNTVLITGGSRGIGFELAKLFARDGAQLVLVAQEEGRLNDAADHLRKEFGATVNAIAVDLSQVGACQTVFDAVQHNRWEVNVLVNNAGFGLYGAFSEIDAEREKQMLEVNIVALTHLTKLFLPGLLAKKSGKILNISSLAAFQPGPLMATYYASKAYVQSFSEALAQELEGSGVTVTVLCPGATNTGFQKRAGLERSALFGGTIADAPAIAKKGYEGLLCGKRVVLPGIYNSITTRIIPLFPRRWIAQIVLWKHRFKS